MTPTKSFYRVREVAAILDVKAHTLRYWEDEFDQLNPQRTEFGQRRYSPEDLDLLKTIKSLLHEKRMSIEGVKKILTTYRKYAPRYEFVCKSSQDAIKLLTEVKIGLSDQHPIARINAVEKWIETLDKPVAHKNIRGKEYYAKCKGIEE